MKRNPYILLLALGLHLTVVSRTHATFSIIAVDPETKEIGSAGATCVYGVRRFGGAIILNDIIPGRGGVNAQAFICTDPHVNLELVMEQLDGGASAQGALDWVLENDGCELGNFDQAERQYGVVEITPDGAIHVAAHTGDNNLNWAGHITGPNYAIQGNILLGPEVLQSMETASLETEGSLADKLMAAMQGAKRAGADARCSDDGTSSTSAFLRVVRPDDERDDPLLELSVTELRRRLEPIDELQGQYDVWKETQQPDPVNPALESTPPWGLNEPVLHNWISVPDQILVAGTRLELPLQVGDGEITFPMVEALAVSDDPDLFSEVSIRVNELDQDLHVFLETKENAHGITQIIVYVWDTNGFKGELSFQVGVHRADGPFEEIQIRRLDSTGNAPPLLSISWIGDKRLFVSDQLDGSFEAVPDAASPYEVKGVEPQQFFILRPADWKPEPRLLSYRSRVLLERTSETSANVSIGDVDGDGHLDISLAKGRHWPLNNRILLGDGAGGFPVSFDLSGIPDRTYFGKLHDMDNDGDLDVVVSNDTPDLNRIYLNDGSGSFTPGSYFGESEWLTRNASIADMNGDGLPDIIVANRSLDPRSGGTGGFNYICLNQGEAQFEGACLAFSDYSTTTITPADFNHDGLMDLVVPHRDGGQSYFFIQTQHSSSELNFEKIPFGGDDASVRASQVGDFNLDGRLDIVTIDTIRLEVAIYYQNADCTFSEPTFLGGKTKTPYALLADDLDGDGRTDIIVGFRYDRPTIYFNQGLGGFRRVLFGDTSGAAYGFATGDVNEDGIKDIAMARSDAPNILYLGQELP